MTIEIALVLAIVAGSLICFVTGVLRLDLVALLVLASLTLTGLVTPAGALSGFSNAAVITMAGMFVISAALARTGVASILGNKMHTAAGGSPQKLIAVIMLVAGTLSAFINVVGLTAMMLPVVMDLARRARLAPSRLLLPLVMGALLGSTTSVIGAPRNIVASNALRESGYAPFGVLDFYPVGLVILVSGVAYVALIGWRMLPERSSETSLAAERDGNLVTSFDLLERFFVVRIPEQSQLHGLPLAASRLGSAVGLHVVAIMRAGGNIPAPGAGTILESGDRLLVEGRPEILREIQGNHHLRLQEDTSIGDRLTTADVRLAEARISATASLVGKTVASANLRDKLRISLIAIMRDGVPASTGLRDATLNPGDTLLLQGAKENLDALATNADFEWSRTIGASEALDSYRIRDRLVTLRVTSGSMLINRTLGQLRLADAAGLAVIAIIRGDSTIVMPGASAAPVENDVLLVTANPADLRVLRALQKLDIEEAAIPDLTQLETEKVALIEVVLAPRTSIVGSTLRELHFREKFGSSVLAIWRDGRPLRTNLRDVPLRFGDSLLVLGPRARLRVLASETDFIALTQAVQAEPRTKHAPVALAGLAIAILPAMLGWLDISVGVLLGAVFVVLLRCLTIDEAYRGIELPAIVLVAALIPLRMAMEETGATALIAEGMIDIFGGLGKQGVLAALCIMTAALSQAVPAPALVVIMAPLAIGAAETAGISPHAVIMGVAMCASGLSSPVGHPANALVMGPGGYRYIDYVKVGLPLTILILLVAIFVLPLVWRL